MLPVVFVVLFVIGFIEGGIGQAFGGATWVTLTVAVHLGFWVTLFFAIAERSKDTKTTDALDSSMAWTLDSRPRCPSTSTGSPTKRLGELIPQVVFLLFFGGAIIWQQFNSVFLDAAGQPIPALDPQLWSFWLPFLLVIVALELFFAVALYAVGRWNWALAIINIVLNLVSAIPLIWLLVTHQLFNLPFFEQFGWEATVTEPGRPDCGRSRRAGRDRGLDRRHREGGPRRQEVVA